MEKPSLVLKAPNDRLQAMWKVFRVNDVVGFKSLSIRNRWKLMRRKMRVLREEAIGDMSFNIQGKNLVYETEYFIKMMTSIWPCHNDKTKVEQLLRALLAYPDTWTKDTPPINSYGYRNKTCNFRNYVEIPRHKVAGVYQNWIDESERKYLDKCSDWLLTFNSIKEEFYPTSKVYGYENETIRTMEHCGLYYRLRVYRNPGTDTFALKYMFSKRMTALMPAWQLNTDENHPPFLVLFSHKKDSVEFYPKYSGKRSLIPHLCFISKKDAFEAIEEFCRNPREAPRAIQWIVLDEYPLPYMGHVERPRTEEQTDEITREAIAAIRPELAEKFANQSGS